MIICINCFGDFIKLILKVVLMYINIVIVLLIKVILG